MTEIERLLQEGKVTEEFLQEEVRDGYTVTAETKKNFAIYIDLTNELGRVCQKYNLRYMVAWGTLIGAVRHKGMIPWDDDIDIWMPRPDFEKLLEIGPSEFSHPYFFQTTLSDENYYYAVPVLMNVNTTCVSFTRKNDCKRGMAISIFPLDGFSRHKRLQKWRYWENRVYNVCAHSYMYDENQGLAAKVLRAILRSPLVPFDLKKTYRKVNRIAQKTKWGETDQVAVLVYGYKDWYCPFDLHAFDSYQMVPFEYTLVPIPAGFDSILTARFGDYMTFPPLEKRVPKHGDVCYPDVPYEEFFKKGKDQ